MKPMEELLYMMQRLRDPDTGCPWDLEQDFSTIAPYTLEETCEVLDAIANEDYDNLCEELGDLLFQVIFHARMAEEEGLFDFSRVVSGLIEKMVRRHPHVFPDGTLQSERCLDDPETSPEQVSVKWEEIKQTEKGGNIRQSALPEKLPSALPSMTRARKIQKAAAKVGFDWPDVAPVYDKIQEEILEIQQASNNGEGQERVTEEMGDLLFACVNLARHLDVDPDMALRKATGKFEGRFHTMERQALENEQDFQQLTLEEMEAYWQEAKG